MNAIKYVTHIELSQQCSVFLHVSDWLLKYVNSSNEILKNLFNTVLTKIYEVQ